MKKSLSFLLTIVLLFSFTVNAYANDDLEETIVYTSTEYFEDGSSIETIITQTTLPATPYDLTKYYQAGTKKLTYKAADGDIEWSATVGGTFEYTNFNCTCIDSTISYSITNTKWKIPSATSTETGNKAIGYVTAKYYYLGVNTKTVNETITLTCSATGVLS